MPIYQTGGYQVKPSAVDKVKQAIQEFVQDVVFTDYELIAGKPTAEQWTPSLRASG